MATNEKGRGGAEPPLERQKRQYADKALEVFNDPVHGHMEFHPLCVAIINTPQFQRLRDVKQLGAGYFVFPGAAHNRFEHSLGVCHLAKQLINELKIHQPELNITSKDALCVQIAGLCHDLGHGPFSHMFDAQFIPVIRKDKKWVHEQASLQMLDHMVKVNKMEEVFQANDILKEDIEFIKDLIHHPKGKTLQKDKSFLYEIVSNKRNGVDVDKWDYFKRDCYNLGLSSPFDHTRFMKFARVIEVDGEQQICVRDKEVFNMYQMFLTRQTIHRTACQHKTVKAVETMIVNALLVADEHIKIPGKDRNMKISECIDDMVAFTNLTDSIFYQILRSPDDELQPARAWLTEVQRRRQYKVVAETPPIENEGNGKKIFQIWENAEKEKRDPILETQRKIKDDILQLLTDEGKETLQEEGDYFHQMYTPYRFIVHVVKYDFGKEDRNAVDSMNFYTKTKTTEAKPVQAKEVSAFLPKAFKEMVVRVLLRPSTDEKKNKECMDLLVTAFTEWWKKTFPDTQIKLFGWSTMDDEQTASAGPSQGM